MQEERVKVICVDGEHLVDCRLIQFCRQWDAYYCEGEAIADNVITINQLKLLDSFYRYHEYNSSSIKCSQPLTSSSLIENMDEKSLNFMKNTIKWDENIQNVQHYEQQILTIGPFFDQCTRLNCEEIMDVFRVAMAAPFYVNSSEEEELKKFAEKWNMTYPLPPKSQRKIVEENKYLFDQIK